MVARIGTEETRHLEKAIRERRLVTWYPYPSFDEGGNEAGETRQGDIDIDGIGEIRKWLRDAALITWPGRTRSVKALFPEPANAVRARPVTKRGPKPRDYSVMERTIKAYGKSWRAHRNQIAAELDEAKVVVPEYYRGILDVRTWQEFSSADHVRFIEHLKYSRRAMKRKRSAG